MQGALPTAAAAAATLALILAAAKTHGRQVRLEREARGHMHVDFRSVNDAWVEGLWRRDRHWFWPTFGILAVALASASLWLQAWIWVPFTLAWAFASAFMVAGAASLGRFLRDQAGEGAWRRQAIRESVGWWSAVAAAAAGVAVLSWLTLG